MKIFNQKSQAMFVFLVLFVSAFAAGLSLDEALVGINPDLIELLRTEEEVYRYDREYQGLKFLPETTFSGDIIRLSYDMEPDVLSEALYLVPYTENTDALTPNVYNMIRQFRNISEVVYHSARKNENIPLFDDVYRIDNPQSKNPLPDDRVASIPRNERFFLHMKEVNFGTAYYRLELDHQDGMLRLNLVNISPLRKFIKAVDRENMSLQLLIIPVDEGFLIHGLCLVKLSNKGTVESMLDPYSAFYRRLYALETWIYNTLHDANRSPEFGDPIEG